MNPVDASWHGVEFVRVVWDVVPPTREQARRAVREMVETCEPLRRRYDPHSARWQRVGRHELTSWCEAVCRFSDIVADSVADVRRQQDEPLGEQPFRVLIGPTWVSIRVSHALGDGWTSLSMLSAVVCAGRLPSPSAQWRVVRPSHRLALSISALAVQPMRTRDIFRRREEYRGGTVEAQGVETVAAAFDSELCRTDEQFVGRIRAWRDEYEPTASVASTILFGVRECVRRGLGEPQPGAEVVYSTRHEIHRTEQAFGNWSAGVYLSGAMESPTDVRERIAEAQRDGLPHAGVVGAALRGLRRRRAFSLPRAVAADDADPRLTLSHIRQHAAFAALATTAGPDFCVSTYTRPNGVVTVSISSIEIDGRLHVNANFYGQRWPRELVAAALADFTSLDWLPARAPRMDLARGQRPA